MFYFKTKRLTWRQRCTECQLVDGCGVIDEGYGEQRCPECEGEAFIDWPLIIFTGQRYSGRWAWGPDRKPWVSVGLHIFGHTVFLIQTGRVEERGGKWRPRACWLFGVQIRGPKYNRGGAGQ